MVSRVLCLVLALQLTHGIPVVIETANLTSSYLVSRDDWYGDSVQLPDALKWKDNVILENGEFVLLPFCYLFWTSVDLRFDPTACGPGLFISDENTHLRQNIATAGNRACRTMTTGWTHGIHYWSMRIIDRGPPIGMTLGIVPSHFDTSLALYPGATVDSFGFYVGNGNKYNSAQPTNFSTDLVKNGDAVGVLVDLDAKTLTYFKNGYILGTAFGQIPAQGFTKFYPAVGFYTLGSWISLIKTFK